MKTAGCIGTLLPDGHISVAPEVVRELGLRPTEQVQVLLVPLPQAALPAPPEELARKRRAAWQAVMDTRHSLAGLSFSLTDEVVAMREEEDR